MSSKIKSIKKNIKRNKTYKSLGFKLNKAWGKKRSNGLKRR